MRHKLTESRITDMLATALGPAISEHLLDPGVSEIMLNADHRLWVDVLGAGRHDTGITIPPADAQRIIGIVASNSGFDCNEKKPILSAEMPDSGFRFQGMLPPLVQSPVFTIRKNAQFIYNLDDYVQQGILTVQQSTALRKAVRKKRNVLVVGGTGSGKTTLVNAILDEIAQTQDRIVIIEDTIELQCSAEDVVTLRARDGIATMTDLLKATMRLRPDRIVVGEVRGGEALALLKAWNTGHPGGAATIHANNALAGLIRLEQLIQEVAVTVNRELIAEAVNVIVYIERTAKGRIVKEICRVKGYVGGRYVTEPI